MALSTIEVQRLIYERRAIEIKRRNGLSDYELRKQANDPEIYKQVEERLKLIISQKMN